MTTCSRSCVCAAVVVILSSTAAPARVPYVRGVPYYCQLLNQIDPGGSCQNTSMAMVLAYYGAPEITPDSISARFGTDLAKTVGGWQTVFNEVARERGLAVRDQGASNGRVWELRRLLEQGSPVVVHGQFTRNGHLIVLLGCDETYYYAHDPAGDLYDGLGAPGDGRHVRYPREWVEKALAAPSESPLRYHVFVPAPEQVSLRWLAAAPDSAVAGEPLELLLEVALSGPSQDGDPPAVTADLSEVGGDRAVPLVRAGEEIYRLEASLPLAADLAGWKRITVRTWPPAGSQILPAQATTEIAVLAPEGLPVWADGAAGEWAIGDTANAHVDLDAKGPAPGEAPSFAVTASPASLFEGVPVDLFQVTWKAPRPIPVGAYGAMRLAFHPGEANASGEGRLALIVNDDLRTLYWLAGTESAPLDLRRPEWQQVEVPMAAFTWTERPIECLGLVGELSGRFYLDDIRLVASRPCPLQAAWAESWPDTVVAGQRVRLTAQVDLLRSAPAGGMPRLVADLSAAGGPRALPLAPVAAGRYAADAALQLPAGNGLREVSVRIEQEEGSQTHCRVIAQPLVIVPAEDLAIYGEGFAPGWEVVRARGAQLDPRAADRVFSGSAALAVQADNFTVDLAPSVPVDPVGYRALRLVFHPGDASAGDRPAFTVMVNADSRAVVRLLGDATTALVLHLDQERWQEVEIPLAAFDGWEGPITSIRLLGNLRGRFFLDDVRLVADRPAASSTAVQSLSTLPMAFALHSNYPNPFNSATTIRFSLERSGLVELAIYNLAGQTVRRLLAGEVAAGEHEVQWDGRDAHGQAMATGVYCCVLRLNSSRSARRMLLLR